MTRCEAPKKTSKSPILRPRSGQAKSSFLLNFCPQSLYQDFRLTLCFGFTIAITYYITQLNYHYLIKHFPTERTYRVQDISPSHLLLIVSINV